MAGRVMLSPDSRPTLRGWQRAWLGLLFVYLPGTAVAPLAGQDIEADSTPALVFEEAEDTYADEAVRALVQLARAARGANLQGIDHYEATVRERIYVGIGGSGFRRERGLFSQQRIARVRWESDGD